MTFMFRINAPWILSLISSSFMFDCVHWIWKFIVGYLVWISVIGRYLYVGMFMEVWLCVVNEKIKLILQSQLTLSKDLWMDISVGNDVVQLPTNKLVGKLTCSCTLYQRNCRWTVFR